MKFVFFVFTFLAVVACKEDSASLGSSREDKKCTMNDVPVDCKTFEPISTGQKVTLKASLSAAVSVSSTQIEFLENNEDTKEITKNGSHFDCSVEVKNGMVFDYQIKDKKLLLKREGKLESYNLYEGTGADIYNSWVQNDPENKLDFTVLTFNRDSVTITSTCHF